MKILFSPSESKSFGGDFEPFNKDSFIFPELYEKRLYILNRYKNFVKSASQDDLVRVFGTKKIELIEKYKEDIFTTFTKKAIQRYEGVAYDYLQYDSLPNDAKDYIDSKVLIFSNLFGVLKASDKIPDYKLKQGETFDDLQIEKFYNENFTQALDEYLKDDDILDLRAGFYEKFYTIKQPYITMKFLKDGKVVSHFAKAYRGEILKTVAENRIDNFEQLMNLELKNLKVEEIKKQRLKTEIIYSIY